ncbi:hypothetical protein E1A91_D13G014400v1 [Gossypium mustelinum]|uniref:Myb-like domain-containing protein n=3 Tax=Gossypium TaxID=3633 RepID=A0A5J5NIL4_GOSBA|nr:hypothetical protein ES319_D13G013700v1 [Gossypium barbadense]PPD98565.1 hypothetical protein GOBAR_DD04375 [Gossypium barbadense]TYG35831.1 hypothetical protein ES288_D13G014700v1 [Gossypium darwinii]TYI45128.1 hypothetical protein E1A91_D13G014400v1 [Gossypium mustelinum]
MDMVDQNGPPHLRRSLPMRTHFPVPHPEPTEPYFAHINMASPSPVPYHEPFMAPLPSRLVRFSHNHYPSASPTTGVAASASIPSATTLFGGSRWGNITNGGNSRWPRQETLTLLEIRIRLDPKFKEANQKGPLWDELSRIMAEEYGYQRSGKKCREKFENLHKYYKKTKQRKAGRQDGKNYRFFRQLELLYGETTDQCPTVLYQTSNNPMNQRNHHEEEKKPSDQSLGVSNSSEFETSSSENNADNEVSAFTKVKDFMESQMNKLIDSQDVWMERMLKAIEDKDQERLSKEEEWRRQETALLDKEHEIWVKERAWVEARDFALMEVVKNFTRKRVLEVSSSSSSAERPVGYTQQGISSLIHSLGQAWNQDSSNI